MEEIDFDKLKEYISSCVEKYRNNIKTEDHEKHIISELRSIQKKVTDLEDYVSAINDNVCNMVNWNLRTMRLGLGMIISVIYMVKIGDKKLTGRESYF